MNVLFPRLLLHPMLLITCFGFVVIINKEKWSALKPPQNAPYSLSFEAVSVVCYPLCYGTWAAVAPACPRHLWGPDRSERRQPFERQPRIPTIRRLLTQNHPLPARLNTRRNTEASTEPIVQPN